MTTAQTLISRLWWGPLRRPFEAVARRTIKKRTKVMTGAMRGARFKGGLAHTLGIYEFGVQQVLEKHLKPGMVFYDVGAHRGYFTLFGARAVGNGGKVLAFEPLPSNQADIERALKENGINHAQIIAAAVSDKDGEADLNVAAGAGTCVSSLLTERVGEHQVVHVKTVALDSIAGQYPRPDFIKMDIEGAEDWALQGGKELLSSANAPVVLMEVHTEANDAFCVKFLQDCGYNVEILHAPHMRGRDFPRHVMASKERR